MKKASSRRRRDPSAASLAVMPEVDFRRYTVRRNPYAARIAAEGSELVHDGPTRASLAEIPEVDLRSARIRRNRFARYLDASALTMQTRRGRPALGDEPGPMVTRSVRIPAALSKALDVLARAEGITAHALMRNTLASRVSAELARHRAPLVAREGGRAPRGHRGVHEAPADARGRAARRGGRRKTG